MKQESQLNKRWAVGQPRTAEQTIARPASAIAVRRLLVVLVLISIGLRLWFIALNPIDPSSSTADDGDYYRRALRFAITGLYIDDGWLIRPPLHVFFFAAWLRIGVLLGNLKLGLLLIQLAQTALSTLNVLLGFGIARRLFGNPWAGLLFAAFLALWFPFVEQPSVLFSELLYSTLFLTHFWLLLRFDASGRLGTLALSGLALGAAALARSPALYSIAFVVLWLVVREQSKRNKEQTGQRQSLFSVLGSLFTSTLVPAIIVVVCCLAVVLPWTARNYIVYHRIIPVDTLGQINMWLDLDKVDQRTQHIETLRHMPQADRQAYAMARAKEILAADPLKPFRNMWPTFQHIWKAQFVEDYFIKESFYDRPLRAAAPLGLFGDLLWLVFTAAGLVGLAAPPREGWHNRLFVLAWVGYTLFTVLIFHVEPRYLLPLWIMIALYGAGVLAGLRTKKQEQRTNQQKSIVNRLSSIVQVVLLVAFAVLLVTYRDYPSIIRQGLTREWWMRAGDNAFARGDYTGAAQDYRTAADVQPSFLDSKVRLALSQLAQGYNAEAQATLAGVNLRTAQFVSELATPGGGPEKAADFNAVEATIGLDLQQWTLQRLRPPATTAVHLGNGTDLGYIAGFSGSEQGPTGSYRWLSNAGKFVLPLPAPLQPGATVALRVVAPQPTPLTIAMGDRRVTVTVTPDHWREYIVPVPPELAGQQLLTVELSAPPFIPLYQNPDSNDMRQLSVMVSDIWVK
jgi:4-amino-4-deoxy-L-arabinose transferase-like glycosyltransferase